MGRGAGLRCVRGSPPMALRALPALVPDSAALGQSRGARGGLFEWGWEGGRGRGWPGGLRAVTPGFGGVWCEPSASPHIRFGEGVPPSDFNSRGGAEGGPFYEWGRGGSVGAEGGVRV